LLPNVNAVNLEKNGVRVVVGRHRSGRLVRANQTVSGEPIGDKLDGVVEHEILNLGTRRERLLNLVHKVFLGSHGEPVALHSIERDKVGPALKDVGRGNIGVPVDANLNVVILERNQRKGRLPVFAKPKPQRIKVPSVSNLGRAKLRLVLGRREKRVRDVIYKHVVLRIDDLASDEEIDVVNVGWRKRHLGASCSLGEVHVAHQVTFSLHANRRHASLVHSPLKNLTLNRVSKVGVAFVICLKE